MDTLVIGLDAATWRVLDPLLEAGALPNVQGLIADGVAGTLSSTEPPMTPAAWTTMSTGVNPGRHGIYDFLTVDTDDYEIGPVDYDRMDRPAVWDVMAAEGERVGVLNFPLAHPPRPVGEFFVSGVPADVDDGIAYPDALQDRIEDGEYRVHPRWTHEDGLERYYRSIEELTDAQLALALELLEESELDAFWTVFMGIDWVQHYLWNVDVDGTDAVERIYGLVDEAIGDLLAAVDDDATVFLVSDHGARPISGEVHLNSLLESWGYLGRAADAAGTPIERARDAALGIGWTIGRTLPPVVKERLKGLLSEDTVGEMEEAVGYGQRNMAGRIDWAETRAFSCGYMGRIFVHDDRRFRRGPVPASEVDSVRADLRERFESLRHPETGDPVVDRVLLAEEVYDGPYADAAPDLLVVPHEWEYTLYGDFGDGWIDDPSERVVDHDPEGVFVAAGGVVDGGRDDRITADAADVAPTLLAAHGMPVLEDLDGEVLPTVVGGEFETRPADEYRPRERRERAAADEDAVSSRLEDLGYL